MALDKNKIAQRIAQELEHNTYVNLGIGIPTLVANYIPKGYLSFNQKMECWEWSLSIFGEEDPDLINGKTNYYNNAEAVNGTDSANSF